jgi:DNA-binding LacI/PurR family transcriptional regulator
MNGPPRRAPNLADVARAAGVSLTTASHSFSGHRPVAQSTRDKVFRVADQLGFHQSKATALVAVLMRPPEVLPGFAFGTSSFAVLAGSIGVACLRRGLSTATCTTLLDLPGIMRRPDGCIVVTPNYGDDTLAELLEKDVPTVSFDPDPGLSEFKWSIDVNYRESAGALIEHMQEQGSRRICAIVGQTDNAYRRAILAACADRIAPGDLMVRIVDNMLGQDGASTAMAELLGSRRPPEAVITSSSVFARGVLTAATAAALDVPTSLRIGTCTDGPAAEFAPTPLTALRIDANNAAERLVDLLLNRMESARPASPEDRSLTQHLVRRAST